MNFTDFMSFGGSGIIGGGLGLLGDAIGMGVQAAENEKNRQWAEKMRDYENEYNSPKQQIARLKEAGLNPALIYQQGAGSMTSASAPSPSNAGRPLGKLDFRAAYEAYMDAQIKDQQLEGLDLANQHQQILNDIANEDLRRKKDDNDYADYMRGSGSWRIDFETKQQSLNNLKDVGKQNEQNLQFAQNEEERKKARHDASMKMHNLLISDQALKNEFNKYASDLQKLIVDNNYQAEELKKRLRQLNYDPDILTKPITFGEFEQVISVLLNDTKLRSMRHSDKVREIQRMLIPLTTAPLVGELAKTIIDYLDKNVDY